MLSLSSKESSGERSAGKLAQMSLAHSGGAGRRLKRLPYDINLWRYLLPSVEKSSMRDHYSFSALTAPPPPRRRRFAAVLAAMAWNLNACTSWPATPHTRRATRAPHSRAPQRHTPASWLSEARRNSVKKASGSDGVVGYDCSSGGANE